MGQGYGIGDGKGLIKMETDRLTRSDEYRRLGIRRFFRSVWLDFNGVFTLFILSHSSGSI